MSARPTLCIIAMVLALGWVGCADEDGSFYIYWARQPAEKCKTPSTDTSGQYNGRGTLDVLVKQGYWTYFLAINNLNPTSSEDGQPERNNLHMKEFRISLDLGSVPGSYPDSVINFSEPISGTAPPGGGKVIMPARVISDQLASMLASVIPKNAEPNITAKIRIAALRSEAEIESSEFLFPITLCNGCLVDFRNTCPAATDTYSKNVCGYPQDTPVTCCQPANRSVPLCMMGDN